jgi:hypothetical protein
VQLIRSVHQVVTPRTQLPRTSWEERAAVKGLYHTGSAFSERLLEDSVDTVKIAFPR